MTILETLALIGGIATAFATIIVAVLNTHNDRKKFYENKITELLSIQSTEIRNLKVEIDRLITENQALTLEVSQLKIQLERRNVNYDENAQQVSN